jgi:hypothetical protein
MAITYVLLAVFAIGFAGCIAALVLQWRLRHHVSLERVRAIDDPAKLYPNQIPPRAVLTDRGLELHRAMWICMGIFAAPVIALVAMAIAKVLAP